VAQPGHERQWNSVSDIRADYPRCGEPRKAPLARDARRSRRDAAIKAYRRNCQANHPTNAKAAIMVTIAATVTTLSQMGPIGHDETSAIRPLLDLDLTGERPGEA
jgi:hypothetical protein